MSKCLSNLLQDDIGVFVWGTIYVEGASSHFHVAAGRPTAFFNFVSRCLAYFLRRWPLARGDGAANFFINISLLHYAAINDLHISLRFLFHHLLKFLAWLWLLLLDWKIGCILFFLFVLLDIDRRLGSFFWCDRLNYYCLRRLECLRLYRYLH